MKTRTIQVLITAIIILFSGNAFAASYGGDSGTAGQMNTIGLDTEISYTVYDDFKTYTSSSLLLAKWKKYTSTTTIARITASVHSGLVSMLVRTYPGNVPYQGGASRTYSTPYNLSTLGGTTPGGQPLKTLSLWFIGSGTPGQPSGNTLYVPIWVELKDNLNHTGRIYWGNGPTGDANASKVQNWTEFSITLADFTNKSVDITKITSFTIGQGTGTANGGTGVRNDIWFDDIVSQDLFSVAPATPASISYPASSTTGRYFVYWAVSTGTTSYQLERSSNNGSTWSQVYSDSAASYLEIIRNGSYRYRVKATNDIGSSGWRTGSSNCIVNIPPLTSTLVGDIDVNGFVNASDLKIIADHWMDDCSVVDCHGANLSTVDQIVNFNDYSLLSQNWFRMYQSGPVAVVNSLYGIPTFKIDANWLTMPGFSNYYPDQTYVGYFAQVGTKVFDFPSTASAWPGAGGWQVWTAWNTYGYTSCPDTYFNMVLQADPKALIMPRLYVEPPQWWLDDPGNQNEMEIMDDGVTQSKYYSQYSGNPGILPRQGPYPSLASTKWRQAMANAIVSYLDHVKQMGWMDHFIGVELSGLATEEWYHWSSNRNELAGYSNVTRDGFRNWLRNRYHNNVTEFQTAWGRTDVDFNTVTVPTRAQRLYYSNNRTFRNPAEPNTFMNVIEWYQYYNELIPETIDYLAKAIKEKIGNTKLVGAFYAYMYEFQGSPEFGHNALKRYNESKYLDYVYVTSSYNNRVLGKADLLRAPAYSVQLHDKVWFVSNDTATIKSPGIWAGYGWPQSTIDQLKILLGWTDTAQKNGWMFRRSAGFNTCNAFYQHFFDLHSGYYNDANVMAEVSACQQFYDRTKNYPRNSNSQVLIVSDEYSCNYVASLDWWNGLLKATLTNPQLAITQMGAPADHILLDDISLIDPNRYKMVVFLNCYNMTDSQRTLVDSLKGNNRLLVFCYAPGYFNGLNASAVANMQSASGITLDVDSNETLRPVQVAVTTDHPLGNAILNAGVSLVNSSLVSCKGIWTDDPCAVRLGYDPANPGHNTMAIKDMGTWKSIYTLTADMPATVYRELARYTGVHIYNENNDTLYANKSYVCIHPSSAGTRTINFPRAVTVYDAMTEQVLGTNITSYTRSYQLGETMIYRYE